MKRKIFVVSLVAALLLCSCGDAGQAPQTLPDCGGAVYYVGAAAFAGRGRANGELRGIWVSQFDMHPVYRDGGRQREEPDYREKVCAMLDNLVRDGFNTVFLQVRPNGDSMYESEIYPCSKYIAGYYGGSIGYDAVGIFLCSAKERGLAVHAWINPYRLCTKEDMEAYEGDCVLKEWYAVPGRRIKEGGDGLLYLDPSYPEATDLIAAGANEILNKYDFDGIHIDDYFYPTEFEFDDALEFARSGYSDLGEFRRANVNRTVKALYEAAHSHGKIFGVAPSGNIYSLENGWYADIYRWCGESGFADYIMPQLYFGFENACCPFEAVLADWCKAVSGGSKLYVGLSAAKCVMGSEGKPDIYAGEAGKYEWRDCKDVIARSLQAVKSSEADGFCLFTYSSLYDPLTGEENPLIAAEKKAFAVAISG